MGYAEQLPSGKFRAVYRDRAGKRKSAGVYTQKRAAQKAADVKEAEVREPTYRDPSAGELTWGAWRVRWEASRGIEPSTKSSEASMIRKHLAPHWDDVPLNAINRLKVREWVHQLSTSGLAASSVRRIVTPFGASLAAAVDAELIPTNPAYRTKLPTAAPSRQVYLSHSHYAAIRSNVASAADRALLDFLVGTGARWGEAAGLHADQVNLARGQVTISNVWDGHAIKPYPKGKRQRHVPLLGWVVEELIMPDDADRCGLDHREGSCSSGLVFPSRDGAARDDRNFSRRVWAPAVEAAGLDYLGATLHDLRHTFASWLIQGGVEIAEISQLLGHASINTTMIYAHLKPSTRSGISAALTDPRGANVGQSDAPARYTGLRAV